MLYTNTFSCCLNNGHTSGYFQASRGIRQGCPISSLLFIFIAEVLSVSLKRSRHVNGITIGQDEFLILQLADDSTVFHKNTESLKSAISLIEQCLGIDFFYSELGMSTKNLEYKFAKIKSILNISSQRELTIKGNITIVKSLAITHFTHDLCYMFHIPSLQRWTRLLSILPGGIRFLKSSHQL